MKKKPMDKNFKNAIDVFICFLAVMLFVLNIVVTQDESRYAAVCSALGGEIRVLKAGDPDEYRYFSGDYSSKKETLAAARALNERIEEEGVVLLKNEADALPLTRGEKITVFGRRSADLFLGGYGSNEGTGKGEANLNEALRAAGFECNPVTEKFFLHKAETDRTKLPDIGTKLTGFPTGEISPSLYTKEVRGSYASYRDAAIVVIGRIGGEGYDLPRSMFWDGNGYGNWNGREKIPGARDKDDHYLQLDQNETDMLSEVCANFKKVIVVINSASAMELGFLDDPEHYAYHENILGAIWIGYPGENGVLAVGKALNGSVNPSGKTTDTYARNFKNDPTWQNFGNNLQEDGNRYTTSGATGKEEKNAWFVEYREGIYTGYRYYETRGYTDESKWYAENVVYPFGYGLSYTEFSYDVTPSAENGTTLAADGTISFDAEVKNVGAYDGKAVVQLYYSAPYTAGGIEKSHVVLGAFAKTESIEKSGGKARVTLTVNVRDLAVYDYDDANENGFKGYEAEGGEYTFYLTDNAHGWADEDAICFSYRIPEEGYRYPRAEDGEGEIKNRFDEVSGQIDEYLSRENNFENEGVLRGASEEEYRNREKEFFTSFSVSSAEENPWQTDKMPTQSEEELSYEETSVKLYRLIGKAYDDPLWDDLLDELTVSQMVKLVSSGDYRTVQIENIGKPLTIETDGSSGFVSVQQDTAVYDTCYYACACVVGATWNEEIAYEYGKMIGNESLVGNERGDGRPYSGWYAPAVNLHRSPFGGRNFEYYSEDGLLTGKIAAALVRGARSKGVYTYCKHFALNEQETNRDTTGLAVWANEQSMRELYFKPFELCVKEGKTTAIMSSFNRIGTTWSGGSYALLTEILRGEWGFCGSVITDYNSHGYMDVDQMLRAGGDLSLSRNKQPRYTTSATDVTTLRNATKNILYTIASSNAMNGSGAGVVWGYRLPNWLIVLFVVDGLAALAVTAWFTRPYRKGWIERAKELLSALRKKFGKEPKGKA